MQFEKHNIKKILHTENKCYFNNMSTVFKFGYSLLILIIIIRVVKKGVRGYSCQLP